jgi:hypothetical protein
MQIPFPAKFAGRHRLLLAAKFSEALILGAPTLAAHPLDNPTLEQKGKQ